MEEQSFHSELSGDDLKHHTLQPGDFVYWERHDQKNSLQSHHKDRYQVLLTSSCAPQTPRNGVLDSHDTPKVPRPDWSAHHLVTGSRDFPELKQVTSAEAAFTRYLDQAW